MKHLKRPLLRLACLISCVAGAGASATPSVWPAPDGQLLVLVVVDQLRYQDLLNLAPLFGPKGFGGLGTPLAARYATVGTETATGHATISTGTWASIHGITANQLYDGEKEIAVVDDPACRVWGSSSSDAGMSAKRLEAPTVAQQLKLATFGRSQVVSVAAKDRSAILLAGMGGADWVLWMDSKQKAFVSSSCFAQTAPDWLLKAHPSGLGEPWKQWTWKLSVPEERLLPFVGKPLAPSEKGLLASPLSRVIGDAFPHPVGKGVVDAELIRTLRQSPPGTTLVLQTAQAAVDALKLGRKGGRDLLMLSLSPLDGVGHSFGTESLERVDTLLRMHQELSAFFQKLQKQVSPARVSFLLTADHGMGTIPELAARYGMRFGRISEAQVRARVDEALERAYPGKSGGKGLVTHAALPSVYLRRLDGVPPVDAARIAATALSTLPGVFRAIAAVDALGLPDDHPVRRACFADRSGDVLLQPKPGWMFGWEGGDPAVHRSGWNEDALVPVLIQDSRHVLTTQAREKTAAMTQVAPTLAKLLGITPPAAALDEPLVVPKP